MTKAPLSHRAMLIALNIRAWKGTASDREVAAQAEISSLAEAGTMTVIKQLTPKYLIQPIKTISALGRAEHYKLTMPGLFKGQALLPTKLFEQYMMTQQEIGDQFFDAVGKFVSAYPEVREKAKHQLGTAFKERDFPTANGIRSCFDYNVQAGPVPEVTDWRLEGVTDTDISGLRGEVEDSVKRMYHDATKVVFDRAKDMLESMARQAKNYSTDAPGAMLRDATIDQMRDIAGLVCDMNITGDPVLDKIGKELLRDFVDISGTELRKSADMRKDIASKAQKILDKMVAAKRIAA